MRKMLVFSLVSTVLLPGCGTGAFQTAQSQFNNPSRFTYTRIYGTPDTETHFENVTVELSKTNVAPPAQPLYAGGNRQVSSTLFLGADARWGTHDLENRLNHPAPAAPHAAEDTGDLTGIYEGELNFASHTLRITATLVQKRDQVAGLWSTSSMSGSGTMTGTVSAGAILAWEGVQTAPCPGSLRGSATIKDRGAILEGPYTITNCQGTTEASFHVERHLIVRNDDLKPTNILGLAIRQE